MTHDPLCPWCREPDCTRHIPNHDLLCPYGELPSPCFTCDLIAKVRADERKQAGQRVESLRGAKGVTLSVAAAAASGNSDAGVGW